MTLLYHRQALGSRNSSFPCAIVKPRWTEVDVATVGLELSLLPAAWRGPEYEERALFEREKPANLSAIRFSVSSSKRPIPQRRT
jgi:hypothetical protein